ncbi:MAG TPA: hypothetical protein VN375_19260 [Vicinamibacteria bacterium]|jgi:hypothetical protein|nr:hypothetical protein [Vicinamibacteria bacterium]
MTCCYQCGRPIGYNIPDPALCAVCEQTIESDAAVAALPEVPQFQPLVIASEPTA